MMNVAASGWTPWGWLAALGLGFLAAWAYRKHDARGAGEGTDAGRPFVSGNKLERPEDAHFAGSHLYRGFFEALAGYYEKLTAFHSGKLRDYFLAFAAFLALYLLAARLCL